MANLSQAEFKVAYASIIKGWSTEKSGKMPSRDLLNQAASLGHAHQSNNTVIGAMGLRPNGFTRSQMIAYCPPCMNSRKADIEAGLIKAITLPKVDGKTVYAQTFIRAKVKVAAAVKVAATTAPKGEAKAKRTHKGKRKAVKADKADK